ncbi:MAG: hypothetical protein VKJ46_12985 [Leptolyngbyaceae bacterium]|nr:hypothetical protein [Leptolyngbyaceae bacterium]
MSVLTDRDRENQNSPLYGIAESRDESAPLPPQFWGELDKFKVLQNWGIEGACRDWRISQIIP